MGDGEKGRRELLSEISGGREGGNGQVELTLRSCRGMILNDTSIFNRGKSVPMS